MPNMASKLAETFALFALVGSARDLARPVGLDRRRPGAGGKPERIELASDDDDCDEPWADNRLW